MDIGTISRRYAIALYKYACNHKAEKRVYTGILALGKSYLQYPALQRTATNPILPRQKKEELLLLAAGKNVCKEFVTFIKLVVKQKREMFLPIICFSYQAIYRYEKKLLHLHIITAAPIGKSIQTQIAGKFEHFTHETADVETAIEPHIMGGYIVRWDTYRWDASVATRLKLIERELKNTAKTD